MFSDLEIVRRVWPPDPGLPESACGGLDISRKNDWGADEWRVYAQFLELKGYELEIELYRTKLDLIEQMKKANTRKPFNPAKRGLLSVLNRRGSIRGQKNASRVNAFAFAQLVIEKQREQASSGKKITDLQALAAVCDDLGLSRVQKSAIVKSRSIMDRISELRLKKKYERSSLF